jgi:hypothetical protein
VLPADPAPPAAARARPQLPPQARRTPRPDNANFGKPAGKLDADTRDARDPVVVVGQAGPAMNAARAAAPPLPMLPPPVASDGVQPHTLPGRCPLRPRRVSASVPEFEICSPAARLAALGITLPKAAVPLAPTCQQNAPGAYVYTWGQLPLVDGTLLATGKLGAAVAIAEARARARKTREPEEAIFNQGRMGHWPPLGRPWPA